MTSAAAIVVLVAASFAFADVVLIQALGVGVAIAVALDATRGAGAPGALDDAPAGPLELVDARGACGGAWAMPRCSRHEASGSARSRLLLVLWRCVLVAVRRPDPRPTRARRPRRPSRVATPAASRPPDPQPVELPRDDGPHDRLTEWWYDTGHLVAADGRRFGFELVVFRAERGDLPVAWASHLAVTDEDGDRFLYDQRSQLGRAGRPDPSPEAASTWRSARTSCRASPIRASPRGRCAAADGRDRVAALGTAADGTPLRAGAGPRPRDDATGAPRPRRLRRLRGRGWLLLLLPHASSPRAGR